MNRKPAPRNKLARRLKRGPAEAGLRLGETMSEALLCGKRRHSTFKLHQVNYLFKERLDRRNEGALRRSRSGMEIVIKTTGRCGAPPASFAQRKYPLQHKCFRGPRKNILLCYSSTLALGVQPQSHSPPPEPATYDSVRTTGAHRGPSEREGGTGGSSEAGPPRKAH